MVFVVIIIFAANLKLVNQLDENPKPPSEASSSLDCDGENLELDSDTDQYTEGEFFQSRLSPRLTVEELQQDLQVRLTINT